MRASCRFIANVLAPCISALALFLLLLLPLSTVVYNVWGEFSQFVIPLAIRTDCQNLSEQRILKCCQLAAFFHGLSLAPRLLKKPWRSIAVGCSFVVEISWDVALPALRFDRLLHKTLVKLLVLGRFWWIASRHAPDPK